ncbi:MAG TPA: GGDEF domain-containing protein [Tichowtungia sp.]|nr:GGDEF domain-containing protein [Tichowtungia sp.]
MPSLYSPFVSQLPYLQAGQLLLVTGVSFAIITLIASTYRFYSMIELNEEDLSTPEDCNNFFFVNVTRYLSKINRVSNGFGILIIQFHSEESALRSVQEDLLKLVNSIIREDCDKACLYREDCVAVIIDTDDDKITQAVERVTAALADKISEVPAVTAFRAGAGQFPGNGLTSQMIIDAADQAMETASFSKAAAVSLAPLDELPEEEETDSDELGELREKDRSSATDPLTGVLKPEVVGSYMRKYLAEIRQKKNPASVLCAGINRIDNIIDLQGEEAADAVIAGVSGVIQRVTRDSDLIGRYHRNDFLVLAPCSLEQGEMIAIRLREAVQKETFLFNGRPIRTSISVGISGHPEHGRGMRDLFPAAYAALTVIREWKTSTCLVYDPEKHSKKNLHEPSSKTRR